MNTPTITDSPDHVSAVSSPATLLACRDCGSPAELTLAHNIQMIESAVQCPHGCHIYCGPADWCVREWNKDMARQANEKPCEGSEK